MTMCDVSNLYLKIEKESNNVHDLHGSDLIGKEI